MTPFESLVRRIEELERRLNNVVREGRAVAVDAQKGVRVAIAEGADGKPVLSPWIKPMEHAGTLVTWSPTKEGQWFKLVSPNGEIGPNSIAIPHSYANTVAQPSSDLTEPCFQVGGAKIALKDGRATISAAQIALVGKVAIDGAITCNGKDISDTHIHGGVVPGGGNTDVPV